MWSLPGHYNAELLVQMFGFTTAIGTALVALLKVNEGVAVTRESKDVQVETRELLDGRMTQMMEMMQQMSTAEGEKTGEETGRIAEVKRVSDLSHSLQEGRDQVTEERSHE